MWWVIGGILLTCFVIWFAIEIKNAPYLDESDPANPRFVYKTKEGKRSDKHRSSTPDGSP